MWLIELALGSPGRALHMNRDEQIENVRAAGTLWESLPGASVRSLLGRADGYTKAAKPSRAEIEERLRNLLFPATQSLRAGERAAAESVKLIQEALKKLRQNVQPALVYDYLLMQLARQRK